MIVALDGGVEHVAPGVIPRLVISGVNLGPNMSQDSYHSGTMGAAREAGLYGMPAIASSLGSFELDGMEGAVQATVDLVEVALQALPLVPENLRRPHIDVSASHLTRWPDVPSTPAWADDPKGALRTAFQHGELMLNLNVPPVWDGSVNTTRLGMRSALVPLRKMKRLCSQLAAPPSTTHLFTKVTVTQLMPVTQV
jgi:broad specificity polyphosphatase/5'/3'-nucleotidase SurE